MRFQYMIALASSALMKCLKAVAILDSEPLGQPLTGRCFSFFIVQMCRDSQRRNQVVDLSLRRTVCPKYTRISSEFTVCSTTMRLCAPRFKGLAKSGALSRVLLLHLLAPNTMPSGEPPNEILSPWTKSP